MTNYQNVVESLLNRPSSETQIACFKDDPDVVLGYAITEPDILHWVYVKKAWRGLGIAQKLTSKPFKTITHFTGRMIERNAADNPKLRIKNITFNPFKI